MSESFDVAKFSHLAVSHFKEHKAIAEKIRKRKIADLDLLVQQWDEAAFLEVDCLQCANCCKTLGPRLNEADITRLSKFLKLSRNDFVAQYLRIDEDDDFVFQSMPCPFLMPDNYCMVYEKRPKACRDYPHTHQPKFRKNIKVSLENTKTCVVVYQIFRRLAEMF